MRPRRYVAHLLVAVITLVLGMAGIAFAHTYHSTLDYTYSLKGQSRSYELDDLNISLTSNESFDHVTNHTHRIELWRDVFFGGDDYIGFVNVTRDGDSGRRTWSNVGSGDYYFWFTKAQDGVRITANPVHMWGS